MSSFNLTPFGGFPIARIGGGSISAGTELIITDLSLACIKYDIIFSGLRSDNQTQVDLVLTTSTDNGSTFTTSSGAYVWQLQLVSSAGSPANVFTNSDTSASLVRAIGSAANNYQAGVIEIYNPMDTNSRTTMLTRSGGRINADGITTNANTESIMSQRNNTEANNAVRIAISAGTFTMKYTIYGYLA